MSKDEIQHGFVKWFSQQKGFGFLMAESGEEYFFHISDVYQNKVFDEGTHVTFIVGSNERGSKAIDVRENENE